MTAPILVIDWRDEFAELAPYVFDSGGVVRVRYVGVQSAPTAFIQALSADYDSRHERWQSVRLDRSDFNVHFLEGVRSVFERKMRLDLPQSAGDPAGEPSIAIGTDIDGERDVNLCVGDVIQEVHIHGDSDVHLFRDRDRWIDTLCQQLRDFLADGRMMVIMAHSEPAEQDEFWRYMWQDRLELLVGKGLSLVHLLDVGNGDRSIHDLAPAPNRTINLPTAFNASQKVHAAEDMTNILLTEISDISEREARLLADALTTTHYGDIPRLHAEFPALLNELQKRMGSA